MAQGQGGILVFEANNNDFRNRKRAARACQSCQKRKKRCSHTFAKSSDQQAEKDTAEKVLPQLTHKEPVKFVGDLNPESVLTELTQRSKDSPRYSRIGIWVEQSRLEQDQFRRQQEAAARSGQSETDPGAKKHAAVQRYSKIERGRRTLTGHQKNYLQAVGALRVLPKATQDALVTTYVACIDVLFPIIDCKKLLQEYAQGEASVFLIQAICLVACKTEEALPCLRLHEEGPLMDPIPFARALHTGLDAAMKADLEADRFTKVQIMILMSLHNDGPGGIEESSLHLVMAIHDAQTTGLHINTPGRTRNDQAAMLWWTLWTLDKFNACLGGRPLMIAERDIDIDRPTPEATARSQTMVVWLAMGDLLDKVIEFYRPKVDPETAGWEIGFPSFQDLTQNCAMDMMGNSQRSLLEISYNIIGILSCRAGGPASRSYNRRIESADRIQKLTSQGPRAHLPPVPLVPYAISLSLTVAYRGLRDSHSDPIKTQSDLAARCDILESLNKTWWTADAMAKLGRKALKSLQQPASTEDGADARKISDSLEAEVAACKYGPFDGKTAERESVQTTGPGGSPQFANGTRTSNDHLLRNSDGASDRLQVLSQAAAQVGEPKCSNAGTMSLNGLTINDPYTVDPRRTSTNVVSRPNKRPRYDIGNALMNPSRNNAFSPQNGTKSLPDTPLATQTSTQTNTPARTPLTNPGGLVHSQNPKDGVFNINPLFDPFCATAMNHHETSTDLIADPSNAIVQTSSTVSIPANLASPSAVAQHQQQLYNPRLSVPLYYSHSQNQAQKDVEGMTIDMYNPENLDNLFDGFFDLSMPTMFEDPLFDGAAYDQYTFNFPNGGGNSGGPSKAGSVDMNYIPNMQQGGGHAGWQGQGQIMNEVSQ